MNCLSHLSEGLQYVRSSDRYYYIYIMYNIKRLIGRYVWEECYIISYIHQFTQQSFLENKITLIM